ncbi:MAG: thioredoxin domain-containing protein [Thermoanaerobaculia bacterium]|nr:MAG: thioredoxin domain-containing protein [Thermoanaerobaculia bacterium]MBZ0103248.1 DsbA family protein [Thermoanaerobaculia bacterium]
MKKIAFALAAVAVVAGFALGAAWYRQSRSSALEAVARDRAALFVRLHSPVRGAADARVDLVEFTDPACETCAAFAPILEQLLARHPGRVRLVVRYAPLHEGADEVARVLEAARLQGKFWEALHLLYRTQHVWTAHHRVYMESVWQVLPQIGLDMERLRADFADPAVAAVVAQDLADARELGVQKTPGIFVDGRPLEPFGVDPLVALVDAAVRARYPG